MNLNLPSDPRPGEQETARPPRLGIDIGRVIIDGSAHPAGGDTAFFTGNEAVLMATPEVPGAFASIARLVAAFDGQVWLVSKCGPRVQARTLIWLEGHDFRARTGLPDDHIRFCRARVDKRRHCDELGLTHFIDDRHDVHEAIRGTVDHQYLFGPQDRRPPSGVRHTTTWTDAERLILATLAEA